MVRGLTRRKLLHSGAACGLLPWVNEAMACEYVTSTLRITHPWCRATPQEAGVARMCMVLDEVIEADRLVAVSTPVASGAELAHAAGGEPVSATTAARTGRTLPVASSDGINLEIAAGSEIRMAENGIHVRLLGLRMPLEVGRSYPLKLVFESGGVVHASLSVDYQRFF
jgi:periplasmic copper chaperone A